MLPLLIAVQLIAAPAPVYKEKPVTNKQRLEGNKYIISEFPGGGYHYQIDNYPNFKICTGLYVGKWEYVGDTLTMHEVLSSNPTTWRVYTFKFDMKTMTGEGCISDSFNLMEINKRATIRKLGKDD